MQDTTGRCHSNLLQMYASRRTERTTRCGGALSARCGGLSLPVWRSLWANVILTTPSWVALLQAGRSFFKHHILQGEKMGAEAPIFFAFRFYTVQFTVLSKAPVWRRGLCRLRSGRRRYVSRRSVTEASAGSCLPRGGLRFG